MQRGGLSALDAALLVVVPPLGHPACVPDYSAAWHRCQLRLTQSPPALPLPLLMQIRESIKSLFPDRDCFTLVRPHCAMPQWPQCIGAAAALRAPSMQQPWVLLMPGELHRPALRSAVHRRCAP